MREGEGREGVSRLRRRLRLRLRRFRSGIQSRVQFGRFRCKSLSRTAIPGEHMFIRRDERLRSWLVRLVFSWSISGGAGAPGLGRARFLERARVVEEAGFVPKDKVQVGVGLQNVGPCGRGDGWSACPWRHEEVALDGHGAAPAPVGGDHFLDGAHFNVVDGTQSERRWRAGRRAKTAAARADVDTGALRQRAVGINDSPPEFRIMRQGSARIRLDFK